VRSTLTQDGIERFCRSKKLRSDRLSKVQPSRIKSANEAFWQLIQLSRQVSPVLSSRGDPWIARACNEPAFSVVHAA
jgi:hypothetical protein